MTTRRIGPFPPTEYEVLPKIFFLRNFSQPTTVERMIKRYEGTLYDLMKSGDAFFGFPWLDTVEASFRAAKLGLECASLVANRADVTIQVSTVGLISFKDILSSPWTHVDTDKLADVLTAGIRFIRLSDHWTWQSYKQVLSAGKCTSSSSAPMKRYTEAEIQAHLKKMEEEGYGTAERSMAEALMRGLDGKPEGNA